ncbi:hypothetical protein Ae201684_002594 [Aphanomyces euteiches]|uniref:Cysteine dioxygenase n=1 Tax=Aphanomyces euteiches TaxID=100861 RepID=A0A6G0XQ21_9STRA|nr:hypothetical protein Ae201684_002594 [Aphanomyces euteiches]KAH9134425.1 hypothetical protein AeRB84_019765 [Aphanomyces euteiches]
MALDVGQEETIPFTISLHEEAVASPSSKKAAGNGVEMHLIQAIQRAVLQTIKRTGGRAFEMNDILPIKELCDRLLPSDLGLEIPKPQKVAESPRRLRPIQYIEVYEDAQVSMGIFVLPPGTSIPLHNHPQMAVISRVLYGSMQVNAYDLVSAAEDEAFWARKEKRRRNGQLKNNRFPRFRERHLRIAALKKSEVVTGPCTTELLPDKCNIHEFIASGDVGCAIFDILTPGYNPMEGRDCTYYRALLPIEGGTTEEPWHVLEPSLMPPSTFISVDLPYMGPPLARNDTAAELE